MIFSTNKEKGNTALEYKVLKTAQVKSSGCKTKNNYFQVALKSCGGTKGKTYKIFKETSVDLSFIFLADSSIYLIPSNKINNCSTITLPPKYEEYILNF